MDALDQVFKSPQGELSEESLLKIKWKEMSADVCREAPTTWTLLRFDFENYKYNDSIVFNRPTSTCHLQTGPAFSTCQYMLDLLHIDEVSYEGNDCVLEEWFRQLKLDAKGDQLVVWAGDQLTVSRICGLKRFRCMDLNSHDRLELLKPLFGWFHAQMVIEHSLHSQYRGTRAGHGLVHAFELLNRKGLSSPSIQGVFQQNIKDGLTHDAIHTPLVVAHYSTRFTAKWRLQGTFISYNSPALSGLRQPA
jgi:hypothetical protein